MGRKRRAPEPAESESESESEASSSFSDGSQDGSLASLSPSSSSAGEEDEGVSGSDFNAPVADLAQARKLMELQRSDRERAQQRAERKRAEAKEAKEEAAAAEMEKSLKKKQKQREKNSSSGASSGGGGDLGLDDASQRFADFLSVTVPLGRAAFAAEDDIAREQAFHDCSLAAVMQARPMCASLGIKFTRPADYYAEMVKSDEQMEKLRRRLMFDQKKIDAVEKRRREQEARKFGKKVQRNVEQGRVDQKRQDLEQMTRYRKQREKSSAAGSKLDDIADAELFGKAHTPDALAGQPPHKRAKTGPGGPNKRRQAKNKRYGDHKGIKPSLGRRNDADSEMVEAEREARTLNGLNHPNIVNLLGVHFAAGDGGEASLPFLVFEFCDEGSVLQFLQKFPDAPNEVLFGFLHNIVVSLVYLHAERVTHNDIACRNLLVAEGPRCKLGDFGHSLSAAKEKAPKGAGEWHALGTDVRLATRWSSPEALSTRMVSPKSDIWMLCQTALELFGRGEVPFKGLANDRVADLVMAGEAQDHVAYPPNVPTELIDLLLDTCLLHAPEDRLTAAQLLRRLNAIRGRLFDDDSNLIAPVQARDQSGGDYSLPIAADPQVSRQAASGRDTGARSSLRGESDSRATVSPLRATDDYQAGPDEPWVASSGAAPSEAPEAAKRERFKSQASMIMSQDLAPDLGVGASWLSAAPPKKEFLETAERDRRELTAAVVKSRVAKLRAIEKEDYTAAQTHKALEEKAQQELDLLLSYYDTES